MKFHSDTPTIESYVSGDILYAKDHYLAALWSL